MITKETKVKGITIKSLGRWIYEVSEAVHKLNWDEEKTIMYLKIVLFNVGITKPKKARSITCGELLKEYEEKLK